MDASTSNLIHSTTLELNMYFKSPKRELNRSVNQNLEFLSPCRFP